VVHAVSKVRSIQARSGASIHWVTVRQTTRIESSLISQQIVLDYVPINLVLSDLYKSRICDSKHWGHYVSRKDISLKLLLDIMLIKYSNCEFTSSWDTGKISKDDKITRSTGTVLTSAKARLTSVAIWMRIRIRIPESGLPPKFRPNHLFIGPMTTFPENFMQICSEVFAQVANRQTDKQRRKHNLLGRGNNWKLKKNSEVRSKENLEGISC